jgi:hypothetical protein
VALKRADAAAALAISVRQLNYLTTQGHIRAFRIPQRPRTAKEAARESGNKGRAPSVRYAVEELQRFVREQQETG